MATIWNNQASQKLVRDIFEQQHQPSEVLLRDLARIALAGGFAGTRNYSHWRCGSWLDQRVRDAIRQSEQQAGVSFATVLVQEGQNASPHAWEKVVDSYLILPIEDYKTEAGASVPSGACAAWREAAKRVHATWKATGMMPGLRVDLGLPLAERFRMFLEQTRYRRSPGRFFGVRPSQADASQLKDWIRALEEPLQTEILAGMQGNRRTWWRQFRRDLLPATDAAE